MNQQNNPNDLNQNQSVVLKLTYDPNDKYTLRMRLLPDIIEIFDKHPGNHEKQTDYNRVKDDGHWELVFSKEYYRDIDITKRRTPALGIEGEMFCCGNAVGRVDDIFSWGNLPVDLHFDQDEGMTTRYTFMPRRTKSDMHEGLVKADMPERTENPMPGRTKIDKHEGLVDKDNYKEKGYDGEWDIYRQTVYKQDENRTYRFLNLEKLGVGVAYIEGNKHDLDSNEWIKVCHLLYEEERGSTRRTRKYDASVSSSISLDPGTSSSTSLDPGTIQNFDAYSVVDFHEGDITGIKYLECKDDNLWYLRYKLHFDEEEERTIRYTFFKNIIIIDSFDGDVTGKNYTWEIANSKNWILDKRQQRPDDSAISIDTTFETTETSEYAFITKKIDNPFDDSSKNYYISLEETELKPDMLLKLQKGYSSFPTIEPPKYYVDTFEDSTWSILNWKIAGVSIKIKLSGKPLLSVIKLQNKNIILRYLVREVLNATDDDLIQELYNNFQSMTRLKIYKEQQRLDNSSLFTQPISSTTSTSSSTSSSFSHSLVVPRKQKHPYDLETVKTYAQKGIPYVVLDFGEFITSEQNKDQIMITKGYETKYYLSQAFIPSGFNTCLYKGYVKGETINNRNGYGCLYLCQKEVTPNDAYFIIADPSVNINDHGIIKVCEGIWKDDKMWKGTVFVQGIGKDNVKIGKMEIKDGKTEVTEKDNVNREVTEKDNVKTGTIKIEDGRIILYDSPGDSYISLFEYEDLLESIGIDMVRLKEQEDRIRIAIFKKMYQKQYQTNPSRNSVPQISSIPLQDNFLKIEVQNDSQYSEKYETYKKNTDDLVRGMILKGKPPPESYLSNSYQKMKENLKKEKQNQEAIMNRDFPKIYRYHKLNPSKVQIFEKPPILDPPLQGNYNNFAYETHYRQFFQNENKKNIKLDMERMYKDSSQNFQDKVQIPADMKGIYTNVAEFNKIHKEYFQRENIEKNRRNQVMNEIARTLYRLDNNQKKKGSSNEQTAIQRFKKKNIKHIDIEIKNIHKTLETNGIDVSDDVKKTIVQKYNNLVSVNVADKKEKEHQQNSDILNEYKHLVDKIYLEYMPLRAKVSDQQVRIVQEINEIIKNTKNQQYQNEFKAIRKRRIDHLTMVLDDLKNSDKKQGQSQINQVLDQNLKKAYPKLFENMREPTVKVEQNLQQQQDKVILTPTDINLIKAGANIPMIRHDNLKQILLTNSYEKIWRDNFKDSPGIRGVLINLQKTTILKHILDEIKYKLDENYYKKTNFLSKQIGNITQSILSISIPQETQKKAKDNLYYVYVIIDYANVTYKIERERIQKTINQYIEDKILEIQKDFKGHDKIYRIDVKQGETFATRSITTSATNSNRSSDGLEIIVPCKIGGKPTFALKKDDIDFQYKARMDFHAENDISKNMDTEGPITSKQDLMGKFEAEYEYYKNRIGQIQARLAQLASQKQPSDSSDQNKGTSSNILSSDKSLLQQQKANMTKDWLKKIRANPNDDLMCMIIFCFLSRYSLLNPSLDLPVRTVSDDEYRDYKVGYRDDLKHFM